MTLSKADDLEQIPGVGSKIAQELWGLGIYSIEDMEELHIGILP